ncbi:MAG TPA: phosphodiesterase [Thiotrichales bacterium]|nr:phosphodiesterase [Thiotrichales bacterium]
MAESPFTFRIAPPEGGGPWRVLQITDTHLLAEPGGERRGARPLARLERAMAHARRNHWPPHLILATGDLAHDGRRESYDLLLRTLAFRPTVAVAGNHDLPWPLRERLAAHGQPLARHLLLGDAWQVILLESRMTGRIEGALDAPQLEWLRVLLTRHRQPALLVIHHPPFAVGSAWLDAIALSGHRDLLECIAPFPQVEAIVAGHVHQPWDEERGGLRLLASPATWLQFRPNQREFQLDDRPPGYRWLELGQDDRLATGIEYAE